MTSFLENVIADLQNKHVDVSNLTFVLPNKRAGVLLKKLLSKHLKATIFLPEIVSIERFIETLSDVSYATELELLFEFYTVYSDLTPKEQQESFDKFSGWARLLIQDFNEIDRYLVSPDTIFNYLGAIKEISHWSLDNEQTSYVKNYISFWKRLPSFYKALNHTLLEKRKGYQGLVFKEAVNNLEQFISANLDKKFVFIGFNALTKAEEVIVQELLQQDLAMIYWDIDETFINDPIHDAGLFMRSFKTHWPYFQKHPFNWIHKNYTEKKYINVVGAQKQVGQVKYIGELLSNLCQKQTPLLNTAIVLGDENLLIPMLNSIPGEVGPVNITMGLPLKSVPITTLFESLFRIHNAPKTSLYFQDVLSVINNPLVKPLFKENDDNYSHEVEQHIRENNIVYLNTKTLQSICKTKNDLIDLLFGSWNNNPALAIKNTIALIFKIKDFVSVDKSQNLLTLEYLYRFNIVFNELQALNEKYHHIESIASLYEVYREVIEYETLDFQGEPIGGLQIMGMLESRVLDFETVIITSVNEGILPAGKTQNSFIPFDVKLENSLPVYKEKDAVYAYHFYRLIQRAKNIYLVYNTEPDVLKGGEKSRFITQLEIEKIHEINHVLVSPTVPAIPKRLKQLTKTEDVLNRLKDIAKKGVSPSSLTNYIRNPMDFYYEKILGINTYEEIEETVAANTLGTIVHNTLEDLYKPFINRLLTESDLKNAFKFVKPTIKKHFRQQFKSGDFTKGKNLIIFEIAIRYVSNFLDKELETLKAGNTIKILALEESISTTLNIHELKFPIILKGIVDRIDEFNGITRIIDYKTGKVLQNQIEIVNWDDILTDYDKFSKSFQVLCYALMFSSKTTINKPLEGGIVSFKNLRGEYFLKFAKKESSRSHSKNTLITQEILDSFYVQLKKLIIEIFNPKVPFTEKLIK